MTWSIVAFDKRDGAFAIAVATKNLAVGATMPHLRSGVGAIATQSISNRYLADRQGRTAVWTGENCVMWCGSVADGPVSVAGNMLANETVVPTTLASFIAASALPLPEQLLAAMLAGDAAGGDRRGRQSAAVNMITTEDFPDLSLRVDDHATPLDELQRVLGIWRRDARQTLPGRSTLTRLRLPGSPEGRICGQDASSRPQINVAGRLDVSGWETLLSIAWAADPRRSTMSAVLLD